MASVHGFQSLPVKTGGEVVWVKNVRKLSSQCNEKRALFNFKFPFLPLSSPVYSLSDLLDQNTTVEPPISENPKCQAKVVANGNLWEGVAY